MQRITRRAVLASALAAKTHAASSTIGLSIGNYGMKSLGWDDALRTIATTGYDGVELCLISGWPTEPEALSTTDRKQLRALLRELRLALPSLLENLQINGTPEKRSTNLVRLQRAVELGRDLAPDKPPVVETVLGGKTADWERLKAVFVSELREWSKIARGAGATVCFKPHAAHAVQSPERALWLIREVGSPNLRVIYDFSHMQVEGFGLESSMNQLLPFSPFIHIKDARGTPEKHDYLLPGDGTVDYVDYFRRLKHHGYNRHVGVEVSAMVFRKEGYEPKAAARLCYERMSAAMRKAGVERPH